MSELPRRNQVQKWIPAEFVINAAVQVVEHLGADIRLTKAVIFLQAAKDAVADWYEGKSITSTPDRIAADLALIQDEPVIRDRPHVTDHDEQKELAERIVNGLDAANNRFHILGKLADMDAESIKTQYQQYKDQGNDFGTSARKARIDFITRVLWGEE